MDIAEIEQITKNAQAVKRSGDVKKAREILEACLNHCRSDGTPSMYIGLAPLHKSIAKLCYIEGDLTPAWGHYIAAIRIYKIAGNAPEIWMNLVHLGTCSSEFRASRYYHDYVRSLMGDKNVPSLPNDVTEALHIMGRAYMGDISPDEGRLLDQDENAVGTEEDDVDDQDSELDSDDWGEDDAEELAPRKTSGDRSGYRAIYPAILKYSAGQWQEEMRRTDNPERIAWLKGLAEDSQRVVSGVTVVPWPNNTLKSVQDWTEAICKDKLELGKRLTPQDTATLMARQQDLDLLFRVIPKRRLNASKTWLMPFDAIDPHLDESNFSVFEPVLNKMHEFIERGHNWFGVGEWSIANRCYLNALMLALASNNLEATEILVRFLVDDYVAARQIDSAVSLAHEFSQSPFYGGNFRRLVDVGVFETFTDTYESVIVGFGVEDRWRDARLWWNDLSAKLEERLPLNVDQWNIIQLLTDVHTYRKDQVALDKLKTASMRLVRELKG